MVLLRFDVIYQYKDILALLGEYLEVRLKADFGSGIERLQLRHCTIDLFIEWTASKSIPRRLIIPLDDP